MDHDLSGSGALVDQLGAVSSCSVRSGNLGPTSPDQSATIEPSLMIDPNGKSPAMLAMVD